MDYFEIDGGHRLQGEIIPQGAKNEALQILCTPLLTAEPVTISNIPNILDINRLIELIAMLGVKVERLSADAVRFTAAEVDIEVLKSEAFKAKARGLRGSIMLMGPLLARFGRAYMPKPGGDKIGRRRLDTHFLGFEALGATFNYDGNDEYYEVSVKDRLKGTYMLLDEASVTGTANIVMAAVLARGTTTIFNAACEPYLQQLCKLLNRMGARISGIGSNLLTIEGVDILGGTGHRMLADMIEVGSFMGIAAMTQSPIVIKDADVQHLGIIPSTFRRLGVEFEIKDNDIIMGENRLCEIETFIDGSILTISDAPWPGFTPDLISIMLCLATQCKGTVLIHQKMFESRLFFVDKLIDMGAQIILCDPHRASVIGIGRQYNLRAISMSSPDIRAGVALLMAALSAEGKSKIFNIEQIDRGYQNIEGRINALGARIERKTTSA